MKHLLLLTLLALSACQTETPVSVNPQTTGLYRLRFDYTDGSTEYSRILFDKKQLRTTTNLVISHPITLTDDTYESIELKDGAILTIDGTVSAQNIKGLNTKDVYIFITRKGSLITNDIHQNGKLHIDNKGSIKAGGLEMQNGQNQFFNYGTVDVQNNAQLTSGGSKFTNCGMLKVGGTTSIHSGEYEACDCGVLETAGLDVNGTDKVSGQGFIKVTGHANINGHLTKSDKILYCGPSSIKLGAAVVTCENTCTPPAMPVHYTDLRMTDGVIEFFITENSGLRNLIIEQSPDGKRWIVRKKVGSLPGYGWYRANLFE